MYYGLKLSEIIRNILFSVAENHFDSTTVSTTFVGNYWFYPQLKYF